MYSSSTHICQWGLSLCASTSERPLCCSCCCLSVLQQQDQQLMWCQCHALQAAHCSAAHLHQVTELVIVCQRTLRTHDQLSTRSTRNLLSLSVKNHKITLTQLPEVLCSAPAEEGTKECWGEEKAGREYRVAESEEYVDTRLRTDSAQNLGLGERANLPCKRLLRAHALQCKLEAHT